MSERGIRYIFDKDLEKVIPYAEWAERQSKKRQAHFVITDEMEPTRHTGSGKIFDSKSAYREENKRLGLLEVGNDWRNETNFEAEYKPTSCKETLAKVMSGEYPAITPREAEEILRH
jgi:hypothetical protein